MGLKGVLLDTSFVLRFLKNGDPLQGNAVAWFRYLLEHQKPMYFSTVSISEYCAGGAFDDLPLRNLRVLPFNIDHARHSGDLTRTFLKLRKEKGLDIDRTIVLNDVKLLAQAEVDAGITHILTSDRSFADRLQLLRTNGHGIRSMVLDLYVPMAEALGKLDFPEEK